MRIINLSALPGKDDKEKLESAIPIVIKQFSLF